jgi:CDP-4-dehydro-6-deoxyglucose reductase
MNFRIDFLRGDQTRRVDVPEGGKVLDHALANGVEISFACKRGDCGQCAASLVEGQLRPADPSRPLNHGTDVYLCNAVPASDAVLRLPYSPETAHLRVLRSPCKIHALRRLSPDVMGLSLRLPPSVNFQFLAGQFIRLTNGSRVTRSYSLAAGPAPDRLLQIHVRRAPGGAFSEYLFSSAAEGDLLHLEGPMGRFFLRADGHAEKSIFLATGTGIAPIYAMLSSLTQEQRLRCGSIHLYWGNRSPDDAYLDAPLQRLASSGEIQYQAVFSRAERAETAAGDARHVQQLMAAQHASLAAAQVFACGNAAMVESAREQCASLGLSGERFFSDPFTAS